MNVPDHPLTAEEFDQIYSRVPRLTVEVIVKNGDSAIYLTRRGIEPCKGQWHLPGGTARFGEPMQEAVKRIAKRELAIDVRTMTNVGYIEYPSHYEHGLDSPVAIVFEVTSFEGKLDHNIEAQEGGWYSVVPKEMHADQDEFLVEHGYLAAK